MIYAAVKTLPIDLTGWDDEAQDRFDSKTRLVPTTGCLVWLGAPDRDGYGQFRWRNRALLAHRLAWTLANGQIPDGLTIDHLCRVRSCVNPNHLEPVSSRENTRRGVGPTAERARRTHCPKGHPFTSENVMPSVAKFGNRRCLTCNRDHARKQKKLLNAAAKALGITWTSYVAIHGTSREKARSVLSEASQ